MTALQSDAILARMMALHPKIIDLTLDRVWRLLDRLGNPQNDLPPVIHIAGTNGKGSTQAMIRAGLEAADKRVHAYTSPHLARFHERIRLAGDLISEDHLTAVLDECYAANGADPITYFEITTCAAFLAMARTPADFTLLEVGLGGRLDATNVIDTPALTIITPISIDHEQYLGDTLAKIATEKAGILKRRVPCIVGPQEDEAMAVIEATARRLDAPLIAHGQHWHAFEERGRLIYQDETGLCDLPLPNLPGAHQIENAGAALAALRHLHMGEVAHEAAVTRAFWPARMQRLKTGPLVEAAAGAELWLDGGHNPAAGQALARHLASLPAKPTHLI
ncbi:MAG: bifunctional folylpolyglutamate synthase/dihydrofolate synthase, partial [Roseovarius sp.]|nr:bifunctional folylpolyglutamate synthase/dihydrofolate synthase [Roseovarius sp.]